MKISNFVKAIVFVTVLSLTLIPVSRVFTPNWTYNPDTEETGEGNRFRDFYAQDKDSLDYLVIGASHAFYSFNPMQVYAETGYRGFVISGGFLPQTCSYYWLKEACKYQKPKYVLIDISSLIKDFDSEENSVLKHLLALRFSPLKIEAVMNCSPDKKVMYSAFFPLYSFHDRWHELKKEDYLGSEEEDWYYLRGACLRFITKSVNLTDEVGTTDPMQISLDEEGNVVTLMDKRQLQPEEKEYFEKSLAFCRENGIELIPVKLPTRAWNDEWSGTISEYMRSLGLELKDFHDGDDIGINWEKDTHDSGRHTNYYGNCKTSHYMSEFLRENTDLPDRSAEEGSTAEKWNEDLKSYRDWERENVLGRMEPMGEVYAYLSKLVSNREKYLVLFAGRKDLSALTDGISDSLYGSLGLDYGLGAEPHKSYIAAVDRGQKLIQYCNDRRIKYDLNWKASNGENADLSLISSGDVSGEKCGITKDGEFLSFDERGLNIVVLDAADGMPLSRANLKTDDDGKMIFKSETFSASAAERWNESLAIEYGPYEIRTGDAGADQSVFISDAGNGSVNIKNSETGGYLIPENDGNTEGNRAVYTDSSLLAASDFIPIPSGDGYAFFSLYNGLMLKIDPEGGLIMEEYSGNMDGYTVLKEE